MVVFFLLAGKEHTAIKDDLLGSQEEKNLPSESGKFTYFPVITLFFLRVGLIYKESILTTF